MAAPTGQENAARALASAVAALPGDDRLAGAALRVSHAGHAG